MQADKEQSVYESERKELMQLVEREKTIMEAKQSEVLVGTMGVEEELALKHKATKGQWHLGKGKAVADVAVDKVQTYDDAFAKIQAATGITDINELVTSFINAEGQNFSLFNFANELNQVRPAGVRARSGGGRGSLGPKRAARRGEGRSAGCWRASQANRPPLSSEVCLSQTH